MNPDEDEGPRCEGWRCTGCPECDAEDPENCDHRTADDFDDDGGSEAEWLEGLPF